MQSGTRVECLICEYSGGIETRESVLHLGVDDSAFAKTIEPLLIAGCGDAIELRTFFGVLFHNTRLSQARFDLLSLFYRKFMRPHVAEKPDRTKSVL